MFTLAIARIALASAALVGAAGIAHAELGGPATGIETDRARLGARLVSRAMAGYTRHELTRGNGGAVSELTNARGQVFAVTWSGPGKPDLRRLLGASFAALQAGSGGDGRTMHALRRPPQVDRPDLRIQTAGHMGWFRGVALIPSLAPAGFSTSELEMRP